MIRALLEPRLRGQWNRFARASGLEKLTISAFLMLALFFWIGLFGLMVWLVSSFYGVEIFGPILAPKLLELLVLGLFMLLCFSNVVAALSTYYLSDDLELVLSLPVSRPVFFYTRFLDTVIQSSWMLIFFGVPVFAAYGQAFGVGASYALVVLLVLVPFALVPAAIGVSIASVLVRVFPARKIREALVLLGVLALIGLFVLLRFLRPERFMNAEGFESVAAYVDEIQAPLPLLTPPRWISDVFIAALTETPMPAVQVGLLICSTVGAVGVARWITTAIYDEGRTRSQEARAARLARSGTLDRVLAIWSRPLNPTMRAMVVKDMKTFIRDPAQWSQVFLVASIVVIVLASAWALPLDIFRGPYATRYRNLFAYVSILLVGFIMAAVANRFQFTAVSAEGRAFWIARTSPIQARAFLWAKMYPSLIPMVLLGQTLAICCTLILGAGPILVIVASATAFGLAFGISGIAVGMGAIFPDFKADNVARVASGPSAVMFMVISLLLTLVVVVLNVMPVLSLISANLEQRSLSGSEWGFVVVPFATSAVLCMMATILPLRIGARHLWNRELPNS